MHDFPEFSQALSTVHDIRFIVFHDGAFFVSLNAALVISLKCVTAVRLGAWPDFISAAVLETTSYRPVYCRRKRRKLCRQW